MIKKILFLLILKFTFEEKIIFAWQLNRHGARSPTSLKNGKDIINETWNGPGELTSIGKRMLYLLGVKMRNKYKDFISEKYDPQEIYITSTDINRTIESIKSYLKGFYPNETGPIIQENIINEDRIFPPNKKYKNDFLEIISNYKLNENFFALPFKNSIQPIHINGQYNLDVRLLNSKCKGYKDLKDKEEISKEMIELIKEITSNDKFEKIFKQLKETPENDKKKLLKSFNSHLDAIKCDLTDLRDLGQKFELNNEEIQILKQFIQNGYNLKYISDYKYNLYLNLSSAVSSSIFTDVLKYMKNAKTNYENGNKYTKFLIYSGHDGTINNIDIFMKYIFKTKLDYPEYSSSRHIELYLDELNNYKIRYLSGNGNINFVINYDEFLQKIESNIWSKNKIYEFCDFKVEDKKDQKKEQKKEETDLVKLSWIIILVIDIILILALILMCRKIYK